MVGVARSGTSWLIRALARTPGTMHYYEPDNVDADPTGARPVGKSGFGPYPIIEAGERGGSFGPLWDAAFAGRLPKVQEIDSGLKLQLARAALRLPAAVREPLIKLGSRVLVALPGGPERTAIKTIYGIFSLDWLVNRYDPRVVVLQRNPLNVVSSWREQQIPEFDLATRPALLERYRDLYGEPIGADASPLARTAWVVGLLTSVIGEALDRHPGWLLVNHEELCEDPVNRIRAVCDKVGMPWSSEVERYLDESNRPGTGLKPVRVTKEQPHRWKGRLTEAEVDEINAVLARFPRRGWIGRPSAAPAV